MSTRMITLSLLVAAITVPRAAAQIPPRLSTVENNLIRIGVDLNRGGSITYLADAKNGTSIVNFMDLGREIQQSYYSGPRPYKQAKKIEFSGWSWNPVQAGDVTGNPARVTAHRNNGKTIYVKTIPMQWHLHAEPCPCEMETWIELEGSTAKIRCRLTNRRRDKQNYGPFIQEQPAIYTVGTLYRLFTYDGERPFTNAPLRQIVKNSGRAGRPFLQNDPFTTWTATEYWAALVDDNEWGLGVFHPGVYRFGGGFWGTPNQGGPMDDPTGYISPQRYDTLDHNIVYEYQYVLILGYLRQIRDYVYQHIPDSKPNYWFSKDRQHWYLANATDSGFPMDGHLRLKVDGLDPQIIGPPTFFHAQDVPRLHIRAAFKTSSRAARVYWRTRGSSQFTDEQSQPFNIVADGKMRDYVVNLADSPKYRGVIAQLRFDPVPEGSEGEFVDLKAITWKPQP